MLFLPFRKAAWVWEERPGAGSKQQNVGYFYSPGELLTQAGLSEGITG